MENAVNFVSCQAEASKDEWYLIKYSESDGADNAANGEI